MNYDLVTALVTLRRKEQLRLADRSVANGMVFVQDTAGPPVHSYNMRLS